MFLLFGLVSSVMVMPHEEKAFLNYMRDYNVLFSGEEYLFRLGIFVSKLRWIKEMNSNQLSFKVGINHLTHLTDAEYKSMLGFKQLIVEKAPEKVELETNHGAPESWDWRTKGIVNPIKDQGQCGSCWAFSAIQAAESSYALKTGNLLSFSESNLVDCVTDCLGCNGGEPSEALSYVSKKQDGKFNLEADYPYQPYDRDCQYNKTKAVGQLGEIKGVTFFSEKDLEDKVSSLGVASVAIDASSNAFMQYTGGIFDHLLCNPIILDHAVGVVGYGVEGEKKFWIVRNSWGTSWGEQGYIRMSKGKFNQCGIATSAFVVVNN